MNLRQYQIDTVAAIARGWSEYRKQLIVLPTGAGKTIVFCAIAASRLPEKTLILAHREELIDQAIAKLHRSTGIFGGKEKAEFSATLSDSVVIASVQTMIRRLNKWPKTHFSLVVVDEAHHATADSYQTVLNHFDSAHVLGVTATPDRKDKKKLGKYFETIAKEVSLFDLVHQGYLAPIKIKSLPIKLDLRSVEMMNGDYDPEESSSAITIHLDKIARAVREHAGFRRVLSFLPLIQTSRTAVYCLEREGVAAEHVDGESTDRAEILKRFEDGRTDVLCNAMLLTEGYDNPVVDCVVPLRPTKSRALFAQMVGRGTRIHPGKQDLLLLDFLWLHEKHDLVRPAHLIAGSEDEAEQITKLAEGKCGGNSQSEFDLEGLASEARKAREEKLRAELERKAKRKAKTIDSTELALMFGAHDAVEYEPVMKWEEMPITEGQQAVLTRAGVDLESVLGRGHASKLIDVIISRSKLNLATPKQVRLLQMLGHRNATEMLFDQASAYLNARLGKRKESHGAITSY